MILRGLMVIAAIGFASRAHADADYSLALADRFVQPGLIAAAAAPDTNDAVVEAEVTKDPAAKRSGVLAHPFVGGALVILGYEAILAVPSAAAYADDQGRALAGADAAFAGLTLITPDGGRGETLGGAIGVLALAGGMLAAGNNGASKDQLFFLNWAGLNVAILGGRWIGSRFDR